MATLKKINNKTYKISYIPQGYKDIYKNPYRTVTVTGKDNANLLLEKLELIEQKDKIESMLNIGENLKELTIGQIFPLFYTDMMFSGNYSQSTIKKYDSLMNKLLNDFGHDFYFSKFTYSLYVSKYGNSKKRNTCRSQLICLNHIGNWARIEAEEGRIKGKISSRSIKLPRLVKAPKNALNDQQLSTIFQHKDICSVTKDLIQLYILTGCRISELCRPDFTWEQIDLDNEVAYIKKKNSKKAHDALFKIPFTKSVHYPILLKLHKYFKTIHDQANVYPIPISQQKIRSRMSVASNIVGFKFTCHDLRDTSATILLRKSKNIYAVKEHLGHSSVKVTESSYADWVMEDKKKSSNQIATSLINLTAQ